jgi:flavin reductase (DIM6/NTAB) family NADH-FMN oxidoreductase RutF
MKITSSPNPTWRPGDRINSPVSQMVSISPDTLDPAAAYKILIGSVVPRPIAFVSTLNDNGTVNVAPFSFFNGVSSRPLAVMLAISFKPNGSKKDTLINIERSKEFVVNTVGDWMVEPMNFCSAEYPYGVSELEKVGLTSIKSDVVAPPRVRESPVHFECRLHSLTQVGQAQAGASTVIIGEVVKCHIHQAAWSDGKLVIEELKPISRLGGLFYSTVESGFELERAKVQP